MLIDLATHATLENVRPECVRPMRIRLERAQKFALAGDFAAAAEILSADLKTVANALPHCRLPYPLTWIEVAQNDRPRFRESGIHMPTIQGVPTRIGFLLESTSADLSEFTAYQFWELSSHPGVPQVSHVCMKYSPKKIGMDIEEFRRAEQAEVRFIEQTGLIAGDKLDKLPEWDKASVDVRMKIANAVTPDLAPFAALELIGASTDRVSRMLMEVGIVDWSGEALYLMGVLALLNTINAVQSTPTDLRKLNNHRAKQDKPPLAEHHVLTIHPRLKRHYVHGGGAGGHAGGLAAHLCRGHWKVRKSGIYWWRPHMRGDGKLVEKTYRIS